MISASAFVAVFVFILAAAAIDVAEAAGSYSPKTPKSPKGPKVIKGPNSMTCTKRWSPCYRRVIQCPAECPYVKPKNPNSKACYLDCYSPKCEAVCKGRKPSCNGPGSGCYDPRFIGGDGIVFYFHGAKDEHFALVSDPSLQINARFIGLRPAARSRDFTWIQSLGFLFSSHTFNISAASAAAWSDGVDHLTFSYDGEAVLLPEGHLSSWKSQDTKLSIERTATLNAAMVTIENIAEVSIKAVPVTEEDDKIHGYGIPENNCFVHLEVQFRFFGLSEKVEGVLGRTYQPDYRSSAKPGVDMPVVGGEGDYRTSELLAADCKKCLFSPIENIYVQ